MKLLTLLRRFRLRVRWFFVLRQYALHDNYLPLHLMYESSYPDKDLYSLKIHIEGCGTILGYLRPFRIGR